MKGSGHINWSASAAVRVAVAGALLTVAVGCTGAAQNTASQTQAQTAQPATDLIPVTKAQAETTAKQASTTGSLYTVTRVYDGDTIDAFKDGQTIRVRAACVDVPEKTQAPHGEASRSALSSLVPGQVRLNIVDTDRYGRAVAEIYIPDGRFVNLEMVRLAMPLSTDNT